MDISAISTYFMGRLNITDDGSTILTKSRRRETGTESFSVALKFGSRLIGSPAKFQSDVSILTHNPVGSRLWGSFDNTSYPMLKRAILLLWSSLKILFPHCSSAFSVSRQHPEWSWNGQLMSACRQWQSVGLDRIHNLICFDWHCTIPPSSIRFCWDAADGASERICNPKLEFHASMFIIIQFQTDKLSNLFTSVGIPM